MADQPVLEVPHDVRAALAIALDLDDMVAAIRLAKRLQPYFRVAKVGLELFSAVGPDAVGTLCELGYDVFVDLKLHDIPNTVNRAARVLAAEGASYLTFHTAGGVDMVRAGVEGLVNGAAGAGLRAPVALGVTVLTSDLANAAKLTQRVKIAVEAGCSGLVCAASDVIEARRLAPEMEIVVPGIRLAGADLHDQARPATPSDALATGADLLVVGRAVTAAPDPEVAAAAIVTELAGIPG
jgi:orotidine-5'-phosphate decarboxylase